MKVANSGELFEKSGVNPDLNRANMECRNTSCLSAKT